MKFTFANFNQKLLPTSFGLGMSLLAVAHTFPDIDTTCYQFNHDKVNSDKLIKQQKYTVVSGGGAGGESEQFTVGDKSYEFTTSWDYQQNSDTYEPRFNYTVVKDSQWLSYPAKIYYRDKKTLKKLPSGANSATDRTLNCYLIPSHKIDVCRGN